MPYPSGCVNLSSMNSPWTQRVRFSTPNVCCEKPQMLQNPLQNSDLPPGLKLRFMISAQKSGQNSDSKAIKQKSSSKNGVRISLHLYSSIPSGNLNIAVEDLHLKTGKNMQKNIKNHYFYGDVPVRYVAVYYYRRVSSTHLPLPPHRTTFATWPPGPRISPLERCPKGASSRPGGVFTRTWPELT